MSDVIVKKLLDVGVALSNIKEESKLYDTILDSAMDIVNCDGGTLYTLEDDSLKFRVMITRSQGIRKGGDNGSIDLPNVPLKKENVCARCAMDRKVFKIDDVYVHHDSLDFSGPRRYDRMTGYRTCSMLVIPMEDDKGNIIGVMQFINAMSDKGEVVPFTDWHTEVVMSIASQAAICLTNHNYSRQLQRTLDSLVSVMSTAIDALTPYNANHSKNMAVYGKRFIEWMNKTGQGWKVSPEDERRFIMAVQLHDIGKLVTPLEVMNKETRLNGREKEIHNRFKYIAKLDELNFLKKNISEEEYLRRKDLLSEGHGLIDDINKAGFLPDEKLSLLAPYVENTYADEADDGSIETKPWISDEEYKLLSIRKGTLSDDERKIMENHVVMTAKLLGEMEFPAEDLNIPRWASDHHELLNGTGYPKHKKEDELDRNVRLLTILDVFDALTARDRPYKPPMPIEKAFSILDDMADREGKIDKEILELFKKSGAGEIA
ncbi:MAG: HD domain-containing phosphohydrolase [Anaerovoracaceae bacterium]